MIDYDLGVDLKWGGEPEPFDNISYELALRAEQEMTAKIEADIAKQLNTPIFLRLMLAHQQNPLGLVVSQTAANLSAWDASELRVERRVTYHFERPYPHPL